MPPRASSCRSRSGASRPTPARSASAIRRGAAPWCSRSCPGRPTTATTTSTSTASTPAATTAPRRSTRPSPARLARAGILFAGPGLGSAPGALSPTFSDVAGGAVGHQIFSADRRRQLLVEAAARRSTAACTSVLAGCDPHAFAGGVRYQVAVGRRNVLVFDAFAARDLVRSGLSRRDGHGRFRIGGRTEIQVLF